MTIIYLQHPKHGTKVATMEAEAQQDEQNGWARYEPEELELPETKNDANLMAEPRRRQRQPQSQDS